jgi:hypothetical protein
MKYIMDNIFTLNKYDDEDDEKHINIDDLYEKKRERDMAQLKLFSKMLNRVHSRIQTTSRQRNADKICWFVVPEVMLGVPAYDQGSCIAYIMDKLKQDGFRIQYFHPNTLMITWHHWVPNYVIDEIKTKTGRVYDNQGNDLTPTPDIDYTTNQKYNIGQQAPPASSSTMTNVVYKSGEGVFQRSRRQPSSSSIAKRENDKKYTPIDKYKPSGSMVYDETFLFDMNKMRK